MNMFNEPLYNNTNQIPLKELKVYSKKNYKSFLDVSGIRNKIGMKQSYH